MTRLDDSCVSRTHMSFISTLVISELYCSVNAYIYIDYVMFSVQPASGNYLSLSIEKIIYRERVFTFLNFTAANWFERLEFMKFVRVNEDLIGKQLSYSRVRIARAAFLSQMNFVQ